MRLAVMSLSLALSFPAPSFAATVRGQVKLIEKGGQAADTTRVLVWVEGPKVAPAGEPRSTIRMKGKEFIPRLAVVPLGGAVEFPNQDPILHNVFSVAAENPFDLDLYKKPNSRAWTPKAPGIVHVYCNIHPQMKAIVVVRDNPYWAFAGADGRFTIPDVPDGKWVVKAWHDRAGEAAARVSVAAGSAASLELTLDASRYKRTPHKNKFGKDYDDRY